MFKDDERGRRRAVRAVYELCTFQALREQLRCKEIWVAGADRYRDPAEDLPRDFEARRTEHYAALRKPLDPTAFIDELHGQMRAELEALNAATPKLTVAASCPGATLGEGLAVRGEEAAAAEPAVAAWLRRIGLLAG